MLIGSLLVLLTLSGASVEVPERCDFGGVRDHLQAERWGKGRKALQRSMRAVIEAGGEMDGGDLVEAVRLRAILEAGTGNVEEARWWWHAGLNLQAEGAEDVLALASDKVAAPLREVRVRPRQPPSPIKVPKIRETGRMPSALYTLANSRIKGLVHYEVWLNKQRLERPLLVEATVPVAGVYVALEHLAGLRISLEVQAYLAEMETRNYFIRFSGRGY